MNAWRFSVEGEMKAQLYQFVSILQSWVGCCSRMGSLINALHAHSDITSSQYEVIFVKAYDKIRECYDLTSCFTSLIISNKWSTYSLTLLSVSDFSVDYFPSVVFFSPSHFCTSFHPFILRRWRHFSPEPSTRLNTVTNLTLNSRPNLHVQFTNTVVFLI